MEGSVYNLEYLKSISSGDDVFILDMIRTFIDNVPAELAKINFYIETKNWRKAGEESHKFVSNLIYLSLEKLKTIAIEIEENGIGAINTDKIPDLFLKLKMGCEEVIIQLKHDFNIA